MVKNAALVLAGARRAGIPVIHVVHTAEEPIKRSLLTLRSMRESRRPLPGDHVIYKTKTRTKTSPFSTTGLDVMLREMGRDSLVLMGVSTAGCVLSTIRWAADINYKVAVVSDGCDDPDPEVHRVLTEKIYPRQGPVMTAQEFLQAAGVA